MTKTQAITVLEKSIPALTEEQAQVLAELAEAFTRDTPEDDATRAAIREGLAEADRGEFVSDSEVAKAFARFRSA